MFLVALSFIPGGYTLDDWVGESSLAFPDIGMGIPVGRLSVNTFILIRDPVSRTGLNRFSGTEKLTVAVFNLSGIGYTSWVALITLNSVFGIDLGGEL